MNLFMLFLSKQSCTQHFLQTGFVYPAWWQHFVTKTLFFFTVYIKQVAVCTTRKSFDLQDIGLWEFF